MSTHFPNMSSLFDNLPVPGPSASMFTPEELAQPKQPNYSKKDVPMWTVEEDLLILQLVDQHGKKWSKIAAHLPGRTDNGVRNRWNRMERAHVIKQRRPAGTATGAGAAVSRNAAIFVRRASWGSLTNPRGTIFTSRRWP